LPNPIRTALIASLAILLLTLPASASDPYVGVKVLEVIDGDTIEVLFEKPTLIRLLGVDCPEKGQPYWKRAKQYTSDLVFKEGVLTSIDLRAGQRRRDIRIVDFDTDVFNRVTVKSISRALLEAGLAWWDRESAPLPDCWYLKEFEESAKAAKRGLWADPNPVPPWEWRRGAREP
jgi:micrococcal nuclease